MDEEVIVVRCICFVCGENMEFVVCMDWFDGYWWECRKWVNNKCYKSIVSICKGSWFE